jgi:hypothetical protein
MCMGIDAKSDYFFLMLCGIPEPVEECKSFLVKGINSGCCCIGADAKFKVGDRKASEWRRSGRIFRRKEL